MSSTASLRFGIISKKTTLEEWQSRTISNLIKTGAATPVVLVVDASAKGSRSLMARFICAIKDSKILWQVFRLLSRPRSLQRGAFDVVPSEVPLITLTSHNSPSDEITRIGAQQLDFIVDFTGSEKQLVAAARFGLWAFHNADELPFHSSIPCFWEIFRGDAVTTASLRRRDQTGRWTTLRQACLRTIDYSYARNVDQVLFEAATWPAIVAVQLARGVALQTHEDVNCDTHYGVPSNFGMLRFLYILGRNAIRHAMTRGLKEEWDIGIARATPSQVVKEGALQSVSWVGPLRTRWLADPMPLSGGGKVDVFVESMDFSLRRGTISHLTFDGNSWSEPIEVLDTGTHASYPFILRSDGRVYLIPETYEAREVRLYRAIDFPRNWEQVATLLTDLPALDPTLFQYNDLWWLFCTTQEMSAAKLLAYYSSSLFGPWKAHALNPIKVDVRGSRPAGPPFWIAGKLYRPAQDSSRTYGGRVVINCITELTSETFGEEPVSFVEPDPRWAFGHGLHTLSFSGDYCVIDGKRWTRLRRPPGITSGRVPPAKSTPRGDR